VFDLTICQSHLSREQEPALREHLKNAYGIHLPTINPLGPWTDGPNTDSGATNRKLGSDMGDGVTGGGLHGKDLSKADVSVNIWCYLESIRTGHQVTASCSIGDETVNGIPYKDIVEQARLYIHTLGGFEKFAEWGLIRAKDV
jgi:S-adenosylmethionine synthetase